MPPKKFEIPILRNILPTEVQYLKSIFGSFFLLIHLKIEFNSF